MCALIGVVVILIAGAGTARSADDSQPAGNESGVFIVQQFGAVADGKTDDTAAIQRAIDAAAAKGGGVYLPPGRYLVAGRLKVGKGVSVKGVNQAPQGIGPLQGTIILATGGRDDEHAPPLFHLGDSSAVLGLTVWYPDQKPTDIRPYPWTFQMEGNDNTVENVTLINSYNGVPHRARR